MSIILNANVLIQVNSTNLILKQVNSCEYKRGFNEVKPLCKREVTHVYKTYPKDKYFIFSPCLHNSKSLNLLIFHSNVY